ncbi:MAG: T9SS type A sorting domain-containing protein [Bacteroidetes bacterium]|nr:T9SS type A sorting domain-containing protein [Bacteroidota bacterium]
MKKQILVLAFGSALFSSYGQTTWSDNAAEVFYNNCTQCHNPNGIGPFSLMDYATAYDYRAAIKVAVEGNVMPPWSADTSYQRYFHERLLTQTERDIIINWVDLDGPSGDLGTAPPPPVYNGEQVLPGTPDLVITMPNYMSKATAVQDDYACFSMPTGLLANRKIKAIEVIAGNPSIVHHCLVYADGPGTYPTDSTSHSCTGPTSLGLIGAYTPGATPTIFPETATFSSGMTLEAGSNIVFAMHYPDGSYGEWDQTRVHIYFYPEPVTNFREIYAGPIIEDWGFTIAANTIDTVDASYGPIAADLTLMSVFPHMHLLGKYIQSYGVTPTNDTLNFVRINQWDFHWQEFYFFQYMKYLPVNSTLFGRGIYDNTAGNVNNPNDPPINVSAGLNTTDEMFLVYFHFMLYEPGDELINVDSLNTIFLSQQDYALAKPALIQAYPNPSSGDVTLSYSLAESGFVSVFIYDVNGRCIKKLVRGNQSAGEQKITWDGTTESGTKTTPGLYFYSAVIGGETYSGKLILNH